MYYFNFYDNYLYFSTDTYDYAFMVKYIMYC